jgi:hypothetical protein
MKTSADMIAAAKRYCLTELVCGLLRSSIPAPHIVPQSVTLEPRLLSLSTFPLNGAKDYQVITSCGHNISTK